MIEFRTTTERLDDGTVVLSVEGELDMATAPRFETALMTVIDHPAVIVDLTDCEFLDAAALRVFVKASNHLDGAGAAHADHRQPERTQSLRDHPSRKRFDIRTARAATPNNAIASPGTATGGARLAEEEN